MKDDKLKLIRERLAAYRNSRQVAVFETYRNNQERLQLLVAKHGFNAVVLAGDYAEGTLKQYLSVNQPPPIKTEKVDQAESILKGI